MKTMNLTTALIAMSVLFVACEGPAGTDGRDGVDGSEGPAGQNGLDGTNGTNGTDGTNGTNGTDGTDGQDGEDGINGQDGRDGIDGVNGQDGRDGVDGIDGIDGQDGADGHDGHDGHSGSGPYGVNLEIVSIEGGTGAGGGFNIGDYPVVTFSVTDDDGVPYYLSELSNVYFNLSGPTTHPQVVIYYNQITDVRTASVDNYDGTYTYTFATPVPATFHTVPNDTTDLDEDWEIGRASCRERV